VDECKPLLLGPDDAARLELRGVGGGADGAGTAGVAGRGAEVGPGAVLGGGGGGGGGAAGVGGSGDGAAPCAQPSGGCAGGGVGGGGGGGCGWTKRWAAHQAAVGGHLRPSGNVEDEGVDTAAPSELIVPLLEEWPDLMGLVLACLDPTDCAVLAQVGKPWLAAVVAAKLPRAGTKVQGRCR